MSCFEIIALVIVVLLIVGGVMYYIYNDFEECCKLVESPKIVFHSYPQEISSRLIANLEERIKELEVIIKADYKSRANIIKGSSDELRTILNASYSFDQIDAREERIAELESDIRFYYHNKVAFDLILSNTDIDWIKYNVKEK